jgi:hypothetical protein
MHQPRRRLSLLQRQPRRGAPAQSHALSWKRASESMSIEISAETEARLLSKAREQGLSVEVLLIRLLSGASESNRNGEVRELPKWDLGVKGSLRRSDIYDDAA